MTRREAEIAKAGEGTDKLEQSSDFQGALYMYDESCEIEGLESRRKSCMKSKSYSRLVDLYVLVSEMK